MTTKLTEYLQTAAAAEYLRVHPNKLRKWAVAGAIPMHRNPANDYRLFRMDDLERSLKAVAELNQTGSIRDGETMS